MHNTTPLSLDFVWDQKPKITVAGVIVKANSLLLVKREENTSIAPGEWHIPGGHIEAGESLLTGLRRELNEELNITQLEVISLSQEELRYTHDGEEFITKFVFCRVPESNQIKLNSEGSKYEYVQQDNLEVYRKDRAKLYETLLNFHPDFKKYAIFTPDNAITNQ